MARAGGGDAERGGRGGIVFPDPEFTRESFIRLERMYAEGKSWLNLPIEKTEQVEQVEQVE